MSEFHLISHHLCPYVQRAVIVLSEKQVAFERTYIDLANRPDWFIQKSPLGRVPILETRGTILFESQVIAEYLDEVTEGSLHPHDPLAKARHRAWIEFASATLNSISSLYSAPDKAIFEQKCSTLHDRFARIEPEISGVFFDGGQFQMIDGIWGTVYRYLDVFDQISDFGLLDGLTKNQSWRAQISREPSVINAPPEGYPRRLMDFLKNKKSYISTLIE